MAQGFNLRNIRTLLTQGFTDEELRHLCYDNPEFRPVYEQLAQVTSKGGIVQELIEYAERKELMETLLAVAKELNPARYEKLQPYYGIHIEPAPSSGIPGKSHGPIASSGTRGKSHGVVLGGRVYINRQKELDLFESAIMGNSNERIFLIQAEGGMGKTSLLLEYGREARQMHQCRCVSIDLKGRATGLEELIFRVCSQLGKEHFRQLELVIKRLTEDRLTDVSDNVLIGSTQIHIALDADSAEDGQARRTQITDAFFADLEAFQDRRIIFLVDTFEQAEETVAQWFSHAFLPRVANAGNLIAVIGGRSVPERNLEWAGCHQTMELSELFAEDWLAYAQTVQSKLSAETIRAFHSYFKGRPIEMVNVFGAFS